MKRSTLYPLYFSLIACTALLLFACASLPAKDRAVRTYQTIHATVSTVQDFERAACIPDAADAKHCTSKLAAQMGLTDAKHVELNGYLSDAFALEIKVGAELKAWQTGQPVPPGVAQLTVLASKILTVAEGFTAADSDARRILTEAKNLVAAVKAITDALGGR